MTQRLCPTSDMLGSQEMVYPGFSSGSFAHSVHTTSAGVGLDSRWSVPEALTNAKRKGRARGEGKSENRFWRFRGPRGCARSTDMPGSWEMLSPSFSNGSFVHSGRTWLPGAALGPRRLGAGTIEEREEPRAGPTEAQI